MPNWQTIIVFCSALAATISFKLVLPEPKGGDTGLDQTETRMARLERYRMEHGTCIHCGEPLPHGSDASTLTSSVCPHCGLETRA